MDYGNREKKLHAYAKPAERAFPHWIPNSADELLTTKIFMLDARRKGANPMATDACKTDICNLREYFLCFGPPEKSIQRLEGKLNKEAVDATCIELRTVPNRRPQR